MAGTAFGGWRTAGAGISFGGTGKDLIFVNQQSSSSRLCDYSLSVEVANAYYGRRLRNATRFGSAHYSHGADAGVPAVEHCRHCSMCFSTRLALVGDRVEQVHESLGAADHDHAAALAKQLVHLHRRTLALDAAVILASVAKAAVCAAVLLLFVGTLATSGWRALLLAFGAPSSARWAPSSRSHRDAYGRHRHPRASRARSRPPPAASSLGSHHDT